MVEVVTFTSTLTHASEYGKTTVRFGNVVNQLHHVHGFAHTGTAKQTHFTTFSKRTKQIDHFNACFQQFSSAGEFVELRCKLMNSTGLARTDRTLFVHGVAQNVHDAA